MSYLRKRYQVPSYEIKGSVREVRELLLRVIHEERGDAGRVRKRFGWGTEHMSDVLRYLMLSDYMTSVRHVYRRRFVDPQIGFSRQALDGSTPNDK